MNSCANSSSTSSREGGFGDRLTLHQTDDLPGWLAPFNGPRLVVSVVTDEAARGRGTARRLVATAARRVLAEGAVPTYLHAPDNSASARVAEAVGFNDRGWTVHGLWPRR